MERGDCACSEMERTDTHSNDVPCTAFGALISLISTCGKHWKISNGSGEGVIDKTILLLPCFAQYLHPWVSHCAVDSLYPLTPFPQIALIHPYLNNFSFVWLMDSKMHFSTWRVARVVPVNKLMLERWVSSGAVFLRATQTPLRAHLPPEIAFQKGKVDS